MNSQEKTESGAHPFRRKRNNAAAKRKIVLLLVAVIIAAACITGVTVAFIFDADEPVENKFLPGTVSCKVLETFDGYNKTDVRIENTGDTSVYIRAAVIVTWVKTDENGNTVTHSQVPRLGIDFVIDEGDGNNSDYVAHTDWVKGADGFWYYVKPVEVGGESGILIKDCYVKAPRPDGAPAGYTLSVEIVATAIQATPTNAVMDAWGSPVTGVDEDGKLQLDPYAPAAGENP